MAGDHLYILWDNLFQVFLNCTLRNWKNNICFYDIIFNTIHIDKLIHLQWNNKGTFLFCFMLYNIQSIICTVLNNITQM